MTKREWIESALKLYEGPLLRYTARFTKDVDLARELVQEAFLKLCRTDRASVEGHLREWLYTVCRNSALDRIRRRQAASEVSESSLVRAFVNAPETPSKVVERRLQASRILALLEELSEDQQEVIRLKFQDGFSYAEISEITGHSVSNVGVLIHSGIKRTRERLRELREGSYGQSQ